MLYTANNPRIIRNCLPWTIVLLATLCLANSTLPGRAHAQTTDQPLGQLNNGSLAQWERHVIDAARPTRAVFIAGGDLNGDGLPDIATGGSWYANPGAPDGAWTRRDFGAPLRNMAALHDFTGDGILDVVGSQGVGDEDNSAFAWGENDGGGNFTIRQNIAATNGNFLQGVAVSRYQAGNQDQVAISWQDYLDGTQLLTAPADPINATWTWSLASSTSYGEDLSSADIDRDGDQDLMLGSRWLRNDGTTWSTHDVHDPLVGGPDRNEVADINRDGRLDVVVGSSWEGQEGVLYWYEQPTAATNRWTAHLISDTVIGGGMSLDVADMDGDGDFDVVLGEHDLNPAEQSALRLIIFENVDGIGGAWAPHTIHMGDEHHDGTQVIDIDLDGDLDILSIGWSHSRVLLYENKAIDRQNPIAPQWSRISTEDGELPLPTGSPEQTAALVLDVDKDGVKDFVIGSRGQPGPALVWYQRIDGNWRKHVVESGVFPIEAGGAFYDIDGDGDLDLTFGGDYTSNKIWWWENPYPTYAPNVSWTRRLIKDSGAAMHHDMIYGDFNAGGRAELVFWNQNADQLILAEIPANPRTSGPWTLTPIFSYTGADMEGMKAADIDLDGKPDLVGGGRWFKHTGGNSFTANVIDDAQRTSRTAVGQIVPGGRPEVVLVQGESTGPLKWYQWNGTGWTSRTLLNDVTNGHSLALADANRDGNLDIFVAEMRLNGENPDAHMWYLTGDGTGNFSTEVIATGIGNHEARLADLDGDGDLDILGKPFNWDTPRLDVWLNQNGTLVLDQWTRHVIDGAKPWRAIFIEPGDVDGDGRPDIITGGWWYRNPGSPSGTWVRTALGEPLKNMAAVHDFDEDGDLDVIGTGGIGPESNSNFAWARNDGRGNFTILENVERGDGGFLQGTTVNRFADGSPLEIILSWQNGATGTQSLTVPTNPSSQQWPWARISSLSQGEGLDSADMDRDGDQDIILGTKWLRNDGGAWTPLTLHNPATGDPDRVHLVDMDDDGDLDAVIGYGHDINGKLAWYEQPAQITALWTEHLIANLVNPQSVDVADLDKDGDLDIVVGEHNLNTPTASKLIIYENTDGRGGSWFERTIHVGDEHHDGTQLVDIEGDGDLDIISIGWMHDRVMLYENNAIGDAPLNPSPLADAGPDQVVIDEDGDGEALVQLDGSGSSDNGTIVSYTWRIDGAEVATGPTPQLTLSLGEVLVALTVTDDEGATATDSVRITVTSQAPVIIRQPADVAVLPGYGARFSVVASGAGALRYQWQLNGEEIPGATQAGYTLNSVTLGDNGKELSVVVRNAQSAVTSTPAQLIVLTSGSDNFNACVLNESLWTFTDPQAGGPGASAVTVENNQLVISVPGGTNHDVWASGIQAPYLTLPVSDTDLSLEAKFDSPVELRYQLQGMLILQDEQNFVRFNIQHDGSGARLLGIKFVNGAPTIEVNEALPSGGAPFYLRVTRTGDVWQAAYSYDDNTWTTNAAYSFTSALTPLRAGLFAGNVGLGGPAPAVEMRVDYFIDAASAFDPADRAILKPDGLSVAADPAGKGSVTVESSAAGGCSTHLILTANSLPGWSFDAWTRDGSQAGVTAASTQNPWQARFRTGEPIAANFVKLEEFPLVTTVVANGQGVGGAITRSPDKIGYQSGEIVRLKAVPAPGWRFDGWSGDLAGTDAEVDVTVDRPLAITASFTQEGLVLETRTAGAGRGVITVTPEKSLYAVGDVVRLEAIPAADSRFGGWSGDVASEAAVIQVTMTGSLVIAATFLPDTYALRTQVDGAGVVAVDPPGATFAPETEVTLTAIPAAGWRFIGWSGDLAGSANPAGLRLDRDKTVYATFREQEVVLVEKRVFLPVIR